MSTFSSLTFYPDQKSFCTNFETQSVSNNKTIDSILSYFNYYKSYYFQQFITRTWDFRLWLLVEGP